MRRHRRPPDPAPIDALPADARPEIEALRALEARTLATMRLRDLSAKLGAARRRAPAYAGKGAVYAKRPG